MGGKLLRLRSSQMCYAGMIKAKQRLKAKTEVFFESTVNDKKVQLIPMFKKKFLYRILRY